MCYIHIIGAIEQYMSMFSFLKKPIHLPRRKAGDGEWQGFLSELKHPDILPIVIFSFVVIFVYNLSESVWQENVMLAESFLHGETYFDNRDHQFGYFSYKGVTYPDNLADTFEVNGKHYWHQTPLPAIAFLPFVWVFGPIPLQNYFNIFISIANLYLVYALARTLGVERPKDAFLLAAAFLLGSAFIEIAISPNVWQFNQNAATLFVLLSLYEFFTKKRWGRIGIFSALAIGLRLQLLPIILFFAGEIFFGNYQRQKIKKLVVVVAPAFLMLLFLAEYNYIRVGSVSLLTGFKNNMVGL
ncbi:MAG: DUF2079 domain-containing protein, partial [Candidatus Sungbacteria bacterium]|nr:DUF2079 domain-containing protein [Candidatus Sungbacteria bacterium]